MASNLSVAMAWKKSMPEQQEGTQGTGYGEAFAGFKEGGGTC